MSGVFPTVYSPEEVQSYKARLDPFARAIDRSVAMCTTLDPTTRRAWGEFSRGWRQFCDSEVSWMRAASDHEQAEKYEEHIIRWQTWLAPHCPIAAPPLTRPPPSKSATSVESTVKTVAIAAAVIAVAVAIKSVTR